MSRLASITEPPPGAKLNGSLPAPLRWGLAILDRIGWPVALSLGLVYLVAWRMDQRQQRVDEIAQQAPAHYAALEQGFRDLTVKLQQVEEELSYLEMSLCICQARTDAARNRCVQPK